MGGAVYHGRLFTVEGHRGGPVAITVEDHRSGGQFTMKGHLLWRIRRVIAMKGHCYKSICREGHLL